MEKVIVVVGPTGVGKTKMGVALAKSYDGEVISGDSMQIYRGMDIGTAKVTVNEMDGVVHHLIDVRDPDETYSVSDFQTTVRDCIKDISSRHKMPIIVGGTGLYIKAVLYDYVFEESSSDHEMMKKKYQDYTDDELYAHLKEVDALSAEELHPHNRQRVLRAIEIFESTGKRKSEILENQKHELLYDVMPIGLTLERSVLYERINQRVDMMVQEGLEKEVKDLVQRGYHKDLQSMKAIGYKEWFDYFENQASYEEVIELIKKHSRNYAKRQYTWFNHQMPVNWFEVNLLDFQKTIDEVKGEVGQWIQ